MSALAIIYGVLAVTAMVVTAGAHDPRSVDASRPMAAFMLLISWAVTEFSRMAGTLDAWPAMDAVLAVAIALSTVLAPADWKKSVLVLLVMQCVLHATFGMVDDGSRLAFSVYAAMNNALFVMQLIVVSADGRRRILKDVRDRLSSRGVRGVDIRVRAFQQGTQRAEGVGVNEDGRP